MPWSTKILSSAAVFALAACASAAALAVEVKAMLSGANEVPPVQTSATGEVSLSIADDGAVTGTISTKGIDGTMAHIHVGAAGKNGPVAVKFVKEGDVFKTPAGAKLDAEQMKAFKAGDLYVNVHSAAHKGGEIRAQLK